MHNGIIKRILVLLVVTTAGMMQDTKAQNVAVKSNVLADAFLNPNLGIEIRLAPKWTLDATGQFNGAGNTGPFNQRSDTGSATTFQGTS